MALSVPIPLARTQAEALEGLLVGISSGCNVHAATLLAGELAARGESATIATVLCDSAEKYLSEHFWDE